MSSLQLLTSASGGLASRACRRPTTHHAARSRSSVHQHGSSRARRVSCQTALDSIDGFTPITKRQFCTVSDVMTSGTIICCSPSTTIDEALELLVQHRITGLPVVDDKGVVVGVVSDYDLLALDTLGRVNDDQNLFPEAEQTWQAFKEVKTLLAKTGGKRVADVMTKSPITVTPECDLDRAARILLSKKIRRLPVISQEGVLRGIISRSNIVKAALESRRAALASMEQQ